MFNFVNKCPSIENNLGSYGIKSRVIEVYKNEGFDRAIIYATKFSKELVYKDCILGIFEQMLNEKKLEDVFELAKVKLIDCEKPWVYEMIIEKYLLKKVVSSKQGYSGCQESKEELTHAVSQPVLLGPPPIVKNYQQKIRELHNVLSLAEDSIKKSEILKSKALDAYHREGFNRAREIAFKVPEISYYKGFVTELIKDRLKTKIHDDVSEWASRRFMENEKYWALKTIIKDLIAKKNSRKALDIAENVRYYDKDWVSERLLTYIYYDALSRISGKDFSRIAEKLKYKEPMIYCACLKKFKDKNNTAKFNELLNAAA